MKSIVTLRGINISNKFMKSIKLQGICYNCEVNGKRL